MKSTITFTIDIELAQKIKQETNSSGLINTLLKEYYDKINCENSILIKQKLSELKQIIKENNKKKRFLDKKLKIILEKETKVLEIKKKNLQKELNLGKVIYIRRRGRTIVKYN